MKYFSVSKNIPKFFKFNTVPGSKKITEQLVSRGGQYVVAAPTCNTVLKGNAHSTLISLLDAENGGT